MHFHIEVAALVGGAQMRHSLTPQPEDPPVRRFRGDLQYQGAPRGGDFNLAAEQHRPQGHPGGGVQVVAVPRETGVRHDLHLQVQIGRAAARSRGTLAGILYTGYLAAGLSSVMNNMPTVMVNALAIRAAGVPPHALALPLANVIGSDLGPKITPIGSLATLLWLHVLERRGMRIGWGYYMRVGLVLTIPVLAVTLGALAGLLAWRA